MKNFYKTAFALLSLGFGLNSTAQLNGGETCGTATTIPSIPFTDNGFTTGKTNNYNTVCPGESNGGGGKDVIYKYTTTVAEYINITLCTGTTNFDSQVYVYEGTCTGTPVGCKEDVCSNPPTYNNAYIPRIDNLSLNASTTYYIVVDGYNTGASGNFTINITAGSAPAGAVIPFTDMTSLLPTTTFHSGNAVGVVDMNGDKLDDIVRAANNSQMYIEYQTAGGGNFTEQSFSNTIGSPWGMCVGDMNDDGMNDVMWGTNGAARTLIWNGTNYTTTNITSGSLFTQGATMFDITNDGALDMYICHDVGMSHIYVNSGSGTFTLNQALMPLASVPSSDNSGNYAALWSDVNNDNLVDLYVTHCRQSVSSSSDPRRINQLFTNNGNGTWTQDVTNASNLRIGAQSWSTDFGDLDNDGDMDAFVLNYDVESQLLTNNGSGVFTNIIVGSGISGTDQFFGMNVVFEDFNNDTYLDIFITGDNEHRLYINNGDMTFTLDANAFIYNNYIILSQGTGDLNHDGHIDIYASYADVYNSPSTRNDKLWMNDAVDGNNFITFQCEGTTSNLNGIGAILKIYGPWGVQIREVRSGEAYGIMNSLDQHFGLGSATTVDSLEVIWPSGTEDMFYNLTGNQFLPIVEGSSSLVANVTVVCNDTDKSICAGTSVTFTASPINGGTSPSYQWKLNGGNVGTNSTTYTTTTLANGDIVTCVMTSNLPGVINNPATSNGITMTVIAIPATPTISQAGTVLSSSSATGNQWYLDGNLLSGETNQDITVTTSGTYTVVVTNSGCSSATSSGMVITVADVSIVSSDTDESICEGTSVTFTATPVNGGTSPSYQWKLNGGNVGTNSTTYTTTTLANGDIVTCLMTSNLPGVINNPATSNGITMTVNAIPATPTISQVGSVLSSSSATGNQWYLDGNLLPGETNQDITVTTNGVYTVVVTTSGCSSAASAGTLTTVGIDETENPYLLVVFPNPNDGNFNITFVAENSDNYSLELFNEIGEVVISKQISNHAGTYQLPVRLNKIASGMYTIVLTNGKKESFKKVIVY